MTPEWPIEKLGDLVDPSRGISYGIVQPGEHQIDGVPIVRVSDLKGDTVETTKPLRVSTGIEAAYTRTRLRGGELIISIVGTVGQTAIVDKNLAGWNVARAVAVIPVREEIGPYWIRLSLKGGPARAHINDRLNTTVQATLNLRDLASLPIILPPQSERNAIAATLGALDDKIELNRKMNATLESMARALFRDWFVDFGPTRAKMAGREPGAQSEAAPRDPWLAPDLWSLFPDRLDKDGKPEGWRAATLADVAVARNQGVIPSEVDDDTPYIGLEHMPRGSIALADWEGAGKVSSNKAAFKAGDFLFGKLRPYFHKVGIAAVSGICSTDIVVLRPKDDHWSGFVIACISDADFVAYTDKTSTGTKMPRTSWSIMSKYPLVLPPPALAEAFNAAVAPMLARIRANIHESRTLVRTRDLLLPRLMSGELRVPDAERMVEAAQ